MPPKTTSTWSTSTSFLALAAATSSSVALSSTCSSSRRPSSPPSALTSSTTILATLTLASPTNESGPVWSAISPTLIGPSGAVPMAFSGLEVADELSHLRPLLVPGLLHDRRHVGVGREALPAVQVPVEDRPDAVRLVRVAEDRRALRAVQLALLGTRARVDLDEPVEVLHRRRCQDHRLLLSTCASGDAPEDEFAPVVPACASGERPIARGALRGADEVVLERPDRRGGAAPHARLLVDVLDVVADGLGRDAETVGDRLVRVAEH